MKHTVLTVLVTAMLTSCGGGSGDGSDDNTASETQTEDEIESSGPSEPDSEGDTLVESGNGVVEPAIELTGSFQFLGFVEIIQDDLLDRVNRDVNFLQMTELQTASVFSNSVPMPVDSCKLRITTAIPTDVGVIGFPDASFSLVSAGETLTLSSATGTYATINLDESRFDFAPYPVPDSLVLDIPGDVFPAFTEVAVPPVQTVQNFSPVRNEELTAETLISWTPTGIDDHTINIGLFDFPASDQVVDLRCHVQDDGEFTLPAEVIATLNDSLGVGFTLEGLEQNRRSDQLYINGDALLVVSKSLDSL